MRATNRSAHVTIELSLGAHHWAASPHFLVNDGLMTIFFLLVGREIRHELHDGALSSGRAAVCANRRRFGRDACACLIFLAVAGPEVRRGWAIPTATDMRSPPVLTLLAKRVPPSARLLLLTLAVIDDIGAILIIAFFHSSGIHVLGLWIGDNDRCQHRQNDTDGVHPSIVCVAESQPGRAVTGGATGEPASLGIKQSLDQSMPTLAWTYIGSAEAGSVAMRMVGAVRSRPRAM